MADGAGWMKGTEATPVDLRTDIPHAARVYDVLLGGKTHYEADRQAAAALLQAMPDARRTATENRLFMHRAVRTVLDAGVRQFLDIGTGIPTSPNLHETAQSIDPTARVVYADNDPIVLAHSRALHVSTPEGRTAYLNADIRRPDEILTHPELLATLDPAEPVAVTLLTVLHWLPDSADPHAIVQRLLAAVPSGSHLVVSHITNDLNAASIDSASRSLNDKGAQTTPRSKAEVARFFDGLDLLDPGLTLVEDWRPDAPAADPASVTPISPGNSARPDPIPVYVGVARKP
jgi:hypothetical protein